MLTLKFAKRRFLSSTFWLTYNGSDIGRLDFDARHYGATATYGGQVWRFVWHFAIRLSDLYLNDKLVGTWGVKSLLRADKPLLPPGTNAFPQPLWTMLNDGRTFLYICDNWVRHAKLYQGDNEIIAEMDIKQGIVTIPGASDVNEDSVLLAVLLKFSRLYNQINSRYYGGHVRMFYMIAKPDPA